MKIFELGKIIINRFPISNKIASVFYNVFNYNKINSTGRNNKIIKSKAFLNKCRFSITGDYNIVIIDDKSVLNNCKIHIFGNNNKIWIKHMVCAYNLEIHVEDNYNEVLIGEKTLISGKTHLACIEGTSINIGKECLFSSEIVFRTGDSHSITDLAGIRINKSQNIMILDHVWIGHRVLINKGVSVGNNSIVGTGAIVTKKFDEDNIIIAGVPAEIVKRQINWDKNRIYIR